MAQIAAVSASASTAPCAVQYELEMQAAPAHSSLGLALGWDFAHHGLRPPVEHLFAASPLRQGWHAGSATFGRRTLRAHRHTQMWLLLRTHAWARGRSFEEVQLTPNYLQQIDVEHCPITRRPLNDRAGDNAQRSVDRVRNDAGYAAGNLAVMSRAANAAKGEQGHAQLNALAQSVARGPIQRIAGLGPAEWQRLATLASFVTELTHEEAAQIPLAVLPPNRLRLFNPIQALQALVTRQLATPGWSQRLARIEALLPGDAIRADFNRFVLALAPRVLAVKELNDAQQIRWALEDAWLQPLLQKRWARFALQLTPAQAEALVQRAAAKRLATVHVQRHADAIATEGWALERKGFNGRGLAPLH
ncbi:hypothetical protein [Roseateles violae]|uniref:Uncharacterized protein n=1 Tax=Roseateles violae TaxID=3058042 RepID=A0ABT8DLB6_9BURK|nr:hypothetical protein [Pelomonas sp. PFR6]MDN3919211.1 hypothetical protein [Pelomonas sp. PFR6]